MTMLEYGQNIRRYRLEAGYTVKYMSYITGLAESTIRDIERNARRTTLRPLLVIADHFGVSLDELLGREVKKRDA